MRRALVLTLVAGLAPTPTWAASPPGGAAQIGRQGLETSPSPAEELRRPSFVRPKYDREKRIRPKYERPRYLRPKFRRPRHERPRYTRPKYLHSEFRRQDFERPKYKRPKHARPKYQRLRYEHPKYQRPKYQRPKYERPKYDRLLPPSRRLERVPPADPSLMVRVPVSPVASVSTSSLEEKKRRA